MSFLSELRFNLTTPKAMLGLRVPLWQSERLRPAVESLNAELEAGRITEAEHEAQGVALLAERVEWFWRWRRPR